MANNPQITLFCTLIRAYTYGNMCWRSFRSVGRREVLEKRTRCPVGIRSDALKPPNLQSLGFWERAAIILGRIASMRSPSLAWNLP
jgi:hypothetical protein